MGLVVSTLPVMAVPTITADTCDVKMAMDLSHYTGPCAAWTRADANIDFKNFVFGVGYLRTRVGNNKLMVKCPKGMLLF